MGDELNEMRRRRDGLVVKPHVSQRGPGDGQHKRGEVRQREAQVAPPDQRQRVAEGGAAVRGHAACGKEAGDDEEDLHGDARVVVEPAHRSRECFVRRRSQRPVGR